MCQSELDVFWALLKYALICSLEQFGGSMGLAMESLFSIFCKPFITLIFGQVLASFGRSTSLQRLPSHASTPHHTFSVWFGVSTLCRLCVSFVSVLYRFCLGFVSVAQIRRNVAATSAATNPFAENWFPRRRRRNP